MQAGDLLSALSNGIEIEQSLGRMFMGAVTRINYAGLNAFGQKLRRAGRTVPKNEDIGMERFQVAFNSVMKGTAVGKANNPPVISRHSVDGLRVPASAIRQTALRAKLLDDRARQFIAEHPDAVIVDLGAGLATPMQRVGPPPTVDWYNVDLPNVIALREQVVPGDAHAHSIAASLADDTWTDQIPADRPTFLIADGLLAFVPESLLINLFRHIPEHFRTGEVAINDYGRVSPVNIAAMKIVFGAVGNQWIYRGFSDAHVPEGWSPRLRLIEETSLSRVPEVDLYPTAARVSTRLMGLTKSGARTARILRYRF